MSTFGYRRELKKYEEVDEDELLATLSSEELQELERELADLDDNVPIGLRQKDQTAKTPTGTFDRDALLKYWEDENKKLVKDERMEDERMEDTRMEDKRMEDKRMEDKRMESNGGQEGRPDKSRGDRVTVTTSSKTLESDRKISQKVKKVQSKNYAKKDQAEKKDECKKEALMRSKCPQKNGVSKVSRGDSRKTETPDQNLNATSDRASGNPIVIDETLELILCDDPAISEVNLNNIEDISQETLLRFAEALRTNTHVHVFSLANTHADDRVAFAVSKMLRENRFIRNLNIESNFVSGQGILTLLAALQHNSSLVELRFHNQRHICGGGKVEMEMVQLLRENTTLLKLGYQFDLPGPRMTATSILTRNQDQQRQRRLQQKKEQSPPEGSGHSPASPAENKAPKKMSQSSKTVGNQNRNPPPQSSEPPTRKISEMVKQHEGSNSTKSQSNQRKPKSKKLKNGGNEKESADILKELKKALKPSLQKRQDKPSHLPPQTSSRDDLMAAIRGSSIGSLKKGGPVTGLNSPPHH